MAMRRKPMMDSPPSTELLKFRPEDWPGSPDEVSWYPAYERWCAARRSWESDHPGWLGNTLDHLRDEDQTQHQWMQRWPLDSMGPVQATRDAVQEGVYDPVTGGLRGRLPGEEHVPDGGVGTRYCDWWEGI